MTTIRPLALGKQIVSIPFHFIQHQWMHRSVSRPMKYHFGPHPRQYMLFWMPPEGVPARQSVVVYFHGGGWRLGWPNQFPTVADWFLRQGFPVILPAYRLLPRFSYPDMREDLNLILLKVKEVLEVNGLGDKKLIVGGMSAGATLAAHLAFNRAELASLSMDQDSFSGFLSMAGPLDLNELPDVAPLRGFAGGPAGSEAFKQANPKTWLSEKEHLPILLMHGTNDAIVPYSSSERFLECYNGPKVLHPLPGGSHLDSLNFALNDHSAAGVLKDWLIKC